ncbi:MAG: hypothetical protein WC649_10085 [Desulfobacteria bacterium]
MRCNKCNTEINQGEEREHLGQTLCEDCYMDVLSPARSCDPWAVYSAKSSSTKGTAHYQITDTQAKILGILKETGGIEPEVLAKRLQIKFSELEREIATLRHMEKVRGELRGNKKFVCLW